MNIDITRYHNGKRETYNPEGRAHASVVWDYYQVYYIIYSHIWKYFYCDKISVYCFVIMRFW